MVLRPSTARGHLKIFLGYAPGTGKTHAMLDAAVRRRNEGVRVQVGCLEPRSSAVSLPGKDLLTRNAPAVVDLDALLAAPPDLVIVDDLSAANPSGSRHPRRYQDVQELLENGLDVYTTLDISQLDSLRDAPWQCHHQQNLLTVPDSVFDQAAVIEFIDLPPEELIERLRQTPEYVSGHTPQQFEECFTVERCSILREAALRRVTGRIQTGYTETNAPVATHPAAPLQNRILVCISSHPMAERLIRAGRRMADELNAGWVALYIETPDRVGFSAPHSEQLEKNLALAAELGAEIVKINGHNLANTILDYARENQFTRIILGNPHRSWWQDLFNTTVVDKILRQSGLIDVYVISDERGVFQPGFMDNLRVQSKWTSYVKAILCVIAATIISYPLHLAIEPPNLVMIYLAAVVICSIYWGRGPSIMASVLSVLIFDFFMIEPKLSLTVKDTQYLITLMGFFVVSIVISNLASTISVQVEDSRLREARTNALYNLSRGLAAAPDTPTIYQTIIRQVKQTFIREAGLYLGGPTDLSRLILSDGFRPETGWEAVVRWVMEQGQPAGFGTTTYPAAVTHYHPLAAGNQVIGVLCVQFPESDRLLSAEKRQILDAYTAMAAMAIERSRLAEESNQARLSQEKEKLQTALLNSISHDLRTPLAAITGVLSTLHETERSGYAGVDPDLRLELIDTGWEEAERLNRLVGNLLDMTRLESGALHLHLVDVDLVEVIGSVRNRMKSRLDAFPVHTEIPADLPLIPMDVALIEQVLVNLLDNAIKYSRSDETITIFAGESGDQIRIGVRDHGRGIPDEELDHIFDKFYRGKSHERISGTGLGLAICKGLVEIHNGTVWARNLPGGGVEVGFSLPLMASTHGERKHD
jgi:two-component system sensor histidine kinase KdpD